MRKEMIIDEVMKDASPLTWGKDLGFHIIDLGIPGPGVEMEDAKEKEDEDKDE